MKPELFHLWRSLKCQHWNLKLKSNCFRNSIDVSLMGLRTCPLPPSSRMLLHTLPPLPKIILQYSISLRSLYSPLLYITYYSLIHRVLSRETFSPIYPCWPGCRCILIPFACACPISLYFPLGTLLSHCTDLTLDWLTMVAAFCHQESLQECLPVGMQILGCVSNTWAFLDKAEIVWPL